jgi:hypothetical protein
MAYSAEITNRTVAAEFFAPLGVFLVMVKAGLSNSR